MVQIYKNQHHKSDAGFVVLVSLPEFGLKEGVHHSVSRWDTSQFEGISLPRCPLMDGEPFEEGWFSQGYMSYSLDLNSQL